MFVFVGLGKDARETRKIAASKLTTTDAAAAEH
jgi:hypothetical protein